MGLRNIIAKRDQVQDNQGQPLAGGEVYLYQPQTTTFIASYKDSALASAHAQPVKLSGSGRANIWIDVDCDILIKNRNGKTIFTEDNANPATLNTSESGQLIPNADFELDANANGTPDSWTLANDSGSTNARDTTESSSGAASFRFTSTGSGGGTLITTDFFRVNGIDDLRVHFDIRSTNAAVNNKVTVQWFDINQASISNSVIYNSTANPTSYARQRLIVTPPSNARFAKIELTGVDPSVSLSASTYFDRLEVFYPATVSAGLEITAAAPRLVINDTASATNNKRYDILATSDEILFRLANDADDAYVAYMTITRTLNVVDSIQLEAGLHLLEKTAGADLSGYGQVYANASNELIFRDEGGTETNLVTKVQAGGSDTEMQYNNGGTVLGGIPSFVFNDSSGAFTITDAAMTTADKIFMKLDGLTTGFAIAIDIGDTGNLSTGGGLIIAGGVGGGNAFLSGILDVTTANTTTAARLVSALAGAAALHAYSNIATRTVPVVLIENDHATGAGIALEIQQDASAPHIDLTGANGEGIKFSTAQLSTDVNTLDDYQEGTFTPTLQDASGSDAEGQTYNSQAGNYTIIGDRCFFSLNLNVSSIGTLTGSDTLRIAGLPVPAKNFGAVNSVSVGAGSSLAITAGEAVAARISPNTSYVTLGIWDSTTGTSAMTVTQFSGSGNIDISGSYII